MVYNHVMSTEGTLFKPIKWKKRLGQLFPQVPSSNDKKAYGAFLNRIHRNFLNHKDRKLEGKDCEFAWFYQIMKMSNKRFREENIRICWLWLWISRPWENGEFMLEWKGAGNKNFNKVIDILEDLEKKFGLTFYNTKNISGEKTFYRYRKNELARGLISGIYTQGYSEFISGWDLTRDYKRFINLLKSGTLVKRREFQRRLRITSERLQFLIKLAQEKGLIKIIRFSKNSIGLIYKDTKKT